MTRASSEYRKLYRSGILVRALAQIYVTGTINHRLRVRRLLALFFPEKYGVQGLTKTMLAPPPPQHAVNWSISCLGVANMTQPLATPAARSYAATPIRFKASANAS